MPGIDAVLTSTYDFQLDSNGDILTEDSLDTALQMSLFAERRATASEMPNSHLRRGWIGNESTPDFEIGSKLWLYEQARVTRSILRGIESETLNGLQWLIDEGLAVNIEAQASLGNAQIILTINIARPNAKVEQRDFILWENTGI